MALIKETDYGTPASKSEKMVTLTIDGVEVTVPEGTSIMRAAMEIGTAIPKLCATDMLESFGSCRLCLVEIEGRNGTPASCTTPVAPGISVKTQTPRLKAIRKGVMELYISDHPLDCLTCAANGDCELQDMAGAVGLRDVRYGYEGENHVFAKMDGAANDLWLAKDESNPYFTYDPVEVHRLQPLRARLRRSAGHLRADDLRPRLRQPRLGRHERGFPQVRVRLLRRLRAGLPDRDADREGRDRHRPARAFGHHHLRLLRRRLLLQGGDARRGSRAHGAVEGRQGQPRPLLRQGPLRLRLCDASGPHHEADGARQDHRSVARDDVGRGDRPRRLRVQAHPGPVRPHGRRRHHLVALHERGSLPRPEDHPRRLRREQRRHLRPRLPLADRLRLEDGVRRELGHAGLRLASSTRTSSSSSAPTRRTAIPCSRAA